MSGSVVMIEEKNHEIGILNDRGKKRFQIFSGGRVMIS